MYNSKRQVGIGAKLTLNLHKIFIDITCIFTD